MAEDALDKRARELFDAEPARHPSGRRPQWERQPSQVREVFRLRAAQEESE